MKKICLYVTERKRIMFNILDIPMDCPKTWKLLQDGDTSGVFQLESSGMKALLMDIKPEKFEDLVAVLALYRPAPLTIKGEDGLTMVERYIKVRQGELKPEYLHPDLEPILSETNGQLVYQEQMMMIAGKFAGFSLGERDHLRKAMGKKLPEEMAKLEDKFVSGCIGNRYREELAKELWGWLEKGAGYLFNKSHSASYALISYQTAWLKANHPVKFMCATMSAELQAEETDKKQKSKGKKLEKVAFYIEEAKDQAIKVLPPLINSSSHEFLEKDGQILFGLNAIKGVGAPCIKQIIDNRPYANFEDFFQTNIFKGSQVKKGAVVGLIKAGAFDETDPDRLDLLERYQSTRPKKEQLEKPLVTDQDKMSPHDAVLRWEKEVLGVYLSGHPLEKYSFVPFDEIPVGHPCTVGGEVERIKKIKTKRNQDMAFIGLSTPDGVRDITIFPRQFNKYKSMLVEGRFILVDGKKESKNILAERLRGA
jgi:DNA polymerase-3 subunit alpha